MAVLITEYIKRLSRNRGSVSGCIRTLSWSIHHSFVCDGTYREKGWGCTPHPYLADFSIMDGMWNVHQKLAIATLCALCGLDSFLFHYQLTVPGGMGGGGCDYCHLFFSLLPCQWVADRGFAYASNGDDLASTV